MRRITMIGAIFAMPATGVAAQTAPPLTGHHAMHLIKLPNGDYTVPLSQLKGSGTTGKIVLHPQGLKTIVTVFVFGKGRSHTFSLHTGRDCDMLGTGRSVALAPALTGQPSRTIVSLPIGNLTTHDYVIAAHNATAREQFKDACGRL